MRTIGILGLLSLLLAACLPVSTPQATQNTAQPVALSPSIAPTLPRPPIGNPPRSAATVVNPSSGAELAVWILYPDGWDGQTRLITLVLMPGGIGTSEADRAQRMADAGLAVVIFDADGRGASGGSEDYNGFITQDGLAAVIRYAAQQPGVDSQRLGLVSYSYGVTAASGALARYPDLPVRFYIDWEGPVNRFYSTVGCDLSQQHGKIAWQPCSDDEWWAEREALTFISQVRVPYQRIQSEKDHVQPNNNHALEIVNAAVAGGVPWVRLNQDAPNQTYELNNPPAMIPEAQDRTLDGRIVELTHWILQNVIKP